MTKPEAVTAAAANLDIAVRAYVQEVAEAYELTGSIPVGWTIGIAIVRVDEDCDEEDSLLTECMPGTNEFLARGLASATADMFRQEFSQE